MAEQFFPIQTVDPQKIAQAAVPTAGQTTEQTSQGFNLPNLFMANTGALKGVLDTSQLQQLQNEATKRAGIMTGLGLLAMPKNRGYGSFLPYAAQSYLQFGVPTAQGVVQTAQQSFQTQLDLAKAIQDAQTKQYELVPSDYREYMLAVQDAERKGKPITDDFTEWTRKNKQAGALRFNTEATYAGELAKTLVGEDVEYIQNARKIPQNMRDNDQILNYVQNGVPITGTLAEAELGIKAAASKFLTNDQKLKDEVTVTQLVDSALGSQVFPLIDALNIGARGLDTPAERVFLQRVMTGDITMTNETIAKMAIIRNNKLREALRIYNERVSGPDFEGYRKLRNTPSLTGTDLFVLNELRDPETQKKFNVMSDGTAMWVDNEENRAAGLVDKNGIPKKLTQSQYDFTIHPIFPKWEGAK